MSDRVIAEPVPAAEADEDRIETLNTAARLLGRNPTPAEVAESAIYDDLRAMLRAAREDADLSQVAIASKMNLVQSEVSRLETTVGPGTRFGRLCKYLAACNADLTITVQTAQGRQLAFTTGAAPARIQAGRPLHSEGGSQASAVGLQMLDDILTLDASLEAVGVDVGEASRVRHAFLTRLQAKQQPIREAAGSSTTSMPSQKLHR